MKDESSEFAERCVFLSCFPALLALGRSLVESSVSTRAHLMHRSLSAC